MQHRERGLIYCARQLNLIQEQEANLIIEHNRKVEEYLIAHKKISREQALRWKSFFVQLCLLQMARNSNILSPREYQQAEQQVKQTISFNLTVLKKFAPRRLKEIIESLHKNKIFTLQEYHLANALLAQDYLYQHYQKGETHTQEDLFSQSAERSQKEMTLPVKAPNSEVPKKVDSCLILKKLGEGGWGEVFLAQEEQTQEKVVIKFLRKNIPLQQRERVMSYFIREAQILESLEHPHIVSYKGVGNFKGLPYLKMEYIEGEELYQRLEKGALPLKQATQIIYYLASVVEYGEKLKIVHRDIKPHNIILSAKDPSFPKLIDFGIAKTLGESYESLTQTGVMLGSLFYMSRELIRDAKRCDHRADLYSLGATFYHMLAGVPPFHEQEGKNTAALLYWICTEHPIPLQEHISQLPSQVYQIVERLMHTALPLRYQSAKELRKDLALLFPNGLTD